MIQTAERSEIDRLVNVRSYPKINLAVHHSRQKATGKILQFFVP